MPDGFPQVFGKYVLVRPMARGGMGELFLAVAGETDGFEKLCVVKKVLHSLSDAAVHRRFLDEAKVVVRLNHANLVQVFDAGKVDDDYYLAMELVEGKDLRAVWNRCAQLHRRIPVDVAIFVVREVLRGLHYVHDAMDLDLVHRDISPPNLLVGYRGDIKLTDFGLAKSSMKREMTSPGVVFGRYSYLSPEQARGMPADRRTDLYACAIVLWELLTGRQLFPSSGRAHQEALEAVRNPKVKPPSALVPGVPEGMDEVVLSGLAKDPDQRYAKADDFRSALSEILARDFPSCDADRVAEFMRDIFARESKVETRDYLAVTQEDFSGLRAGAEKSELISISDVLTGKADQPRSTIELGDSDIVELDKPAPRWDERPDAYSLKEAAGAWVGRVVAKRYRIEALLGIGGMGAVFRATHLALGKVFALKVLHSVYTRDSDIITRFMREARAATQTGHPNIIDVLDIGTTDEGDVYFVMELLEGENLGKTIATEGPLAVRRAVHVTRQICRALSAAHTAGIIHRDLKSENVILTTKGKDPDFVKVLDFGICKQMNADSSTTSPGLIMGSPDYMAPEQGAGLEATVASDVYAVGCILFEALGGRLPFEGRNAVDVLMQKGAREAPRVTEFRSEIPVPVADVIARCLKRHPEDRPPSMRALEYELTRAVDGRATAVAAVLGIGDDDNPRGIEEPSPAASASTSMNRAAIAAMPDGVYGPGYSRQEKTQIAPAPMPGTSITGPSVAIPPASAIPSPRANIESEPLVAPKAGGGASRAIFFTLLGGALAVGVLAVAIPGGFGRLFGGASEDSAAAAAAGTDTKTDAPPKVVEPAPDPKDSGPAAVDPALADGKKLDVPTEEPEPAGATAGDAQPDGQPDGQPAGESGDPDVQVIDDGAPAVEDMGVEELLGLAKDALANKRWREPADNSLALALSKLALLEPGNDAIGKLRKEAADALYPIGEKALDKKRWAEAAVAFRDLRSIWPDHAEARAGLIDALYGQGRVLQRHKDYAGALASADELLNINPGEFKALMMRGDALYALKRYKEAKETFRAARKSKPRSKEAKEKFFKASRKVRR